MSNKYSWSAMDGGTIHCSTNSGDEYLLGHQIADRMNMMQDAIDWSCKVAKSKIETRGSGPSVCVDRASLMSLQNRLDRLEPPKTIEQLNDEVIRAAIAWDTIASASNERTLKQASAAWLKFKNGPVASEQS